jgi:hypothetical protein
MLERLVKDLRYALRSLRASPLFALSVILSLAHRREHRGLSSQEIYHLMRSSSEGDFAGEFGHSYPLFQQLSKIASLWGEMFATEVVASRKFGSNGVSNERIAGEAVSGNFFSVLNVGPIVGRVLNPQDDNANGGNHVAVRSKCLLREPLPIRLIHSRQDSL